ncbi:hypothetical protein B0H13DRAFT_1604900, partial [Mycena leptocephala]
ALSRWNLELSRGLTGKKKAAAERKARRQYLSPRDLEDLKKITKVMEVLQDATLDLSKQGVPTICEVLPLYKVVQIHLETSLAAISPADDTCNLCNAIKAGLAKLKIHTDKVLISNYPLIGAVLHPAIRLTYFESDSWDDAIPLRAKIVLEHLYDVYKEELDDKTPTAPQKIATTAKTTLPSKGIWRCAFAGTSGSSTVKKIQSELEVYFNGIYLMADDDNDILAWWKVVYSFFSVIVDLIYFPRCTQSISLSCPESCATSWQFPV